MPKTTLKVVTPHGTFERQTARAYTHVVLYKPNTDRTVKMLHASKTHYVQSLADATADLPKANAEGWAKTGEYSSYKPAERIDRCQREIAEIEARLSSDDPAPWICYRWSQSLRAAMGGMHELQRRPQGIDRIVICDVVTGQEVR